MKTCAKRHVALLLLILALPVFAAKEPPPPRPPLTPGPWAPRAERPSQRPAPRVVREAVPGFLFIEAEDFRDYGGWRLDSQFTHKMGSAYLIASGVGKPIADAVATVGIPRCGVWRVWARTKDWLPEFSPGAFAVVANGREGPRLGVSRRVGWLWERAGDFEFRPGAAELRLRDLSGLFGRCDALILTTDLGYVPPDDAAAMEAERFRLKGENAAVAERGKFDVVDAPLALIEQLGPFAVDNLDDGKLVSRYFPTREAAIEELKGLPDDAVLRATTLEDVFVERIGHRITRR